METVLHLILRLSLFLLGILGISLLLRSLLPHTRISSVGPRLSQLPVRVLRARRQITALDLRKTHLDADARFDGKCSGDGRHVLGGRGSLDVFGGGVEFLVLTGLAGEEDEAGLVGFEAGDVGGQGFLRVVGSSGVD